MALSRDALVFYQSLGFERLPLNLAGLQTSGLKTGQGNNREQALKALREDIGDCTRCKLSNQRKNIVFGEGSPETSIMFIGEAPGSEEDQQGRPFVGDAGRLLTRLINKMGFKREDVYIANIVKCRPPFNRDPEDDEIGTCFPFLKRQIEIIRPRIIVSLGRISARTILNTKIPITKLRGRFYEYEDIPVMPTFHPAYLLRNPKDKWLVWSDMQQVLHRLGLREGK
ncbi:MAG: uracil-DNA glycosylase [Thermodesulfovibrionales bacterium]